MRPAERRPLYYMHGFASAIPADYADSPKISAVAAFCEATGREFRPQNVDYRAADQRSEEILATVETVAESVVFCGASMGGWLARILQLKLLQQRSGADIRAVVFNPAFDLAEFSSFLEGPQVNFVTGDEFDFSREHSRRLIALEQSVDYRGAAPLWVYVDRDDEIINARWSEGFHSEFARFKAYPGGCHSFEHSREALEDFEPGCWKRGGSVIE